jgi:LuxR family maltose regulon positive regulatory protein
MRAREADLCLAQGNLAAAARWAGESGISCEEKPVFKCPDQYIVICRVRIAQGRSAEVIELLERLRSWSEATGAQPFLIQVLALQALQALAEGDREQACKHLERALSLAEPEGYIRTFLDLGAPLHHLLQIASAQILRDRSHDVYIRQLLDAFSSDTLSVQNELPRSGHTILPSTFQPFNLLEPLSDRELEILRLLNTTLTSTEIADQLVIAVSTVRTHIRNIYGKLGVNRRMEALERARELGLL